MGRIRLKATVSGRLAPGVCLAVCIITGPVSVWGQSVERAAPLLTHTEQIRQLSAVQAAEGYPVRVRGVVTDDVPSPDFFVQDATAGVYVEGNTVESFPHLLGDLVEVEGVTRSEEHTSELQ